MYQRQSHWLSACYSTKPTPSRLGHTTRRVSTRKHQDTHQSRIGSPLQPISTVKPVLRTILHTDDSGSSTRGRASTCCLNPIRLRDTDRSTLITQLQPVHSAGPLRPSIGARRGLDVSRLGSIEDIARGSQIESRRAVGSEEVVPEHWERAVSEDEVAAGNGLADGLCGVGVEACLGLAGEGGGVEEGCDCADGYGHGGGSRAGVVLDAAADGNVL